MINESGHDLKRSTITGFNKINSPSKLIKLNDGGDQILMELKNYSKQDKIRDLNFVNTDDGQQHLEDQFDIIDIIMKKFNSSSNNVKSNKKQGQKK